MHIRNLAALVATVAIFVQESAYAQIDSGSDGLSGALTVSSSTQIDLGLAVPGTIEDDNNPNGVYDPVQWVVLFEYTNVTVNSGATLTFKNHPSGAPVVWLVNGNVAINGTVSLTGQNGLPDTQGLAAGGPGGFRGGHAYTTSSSPSGGGFGPGGGRRSNTSDFTGGGGYGSAGGGHSGYGGVTYGNAQVLPLIGGSGGAGRTAGSAGGGGGGGAILVVCDNAITVSGVVVTNGGSPGGGGGNGCGGSGGGIRLVAETLSINSGAAVHAVGGSGGAFGGGNGRIRFEANALTTIGAVTPPASILTPLGPSDPQIWPPSAAPEVSITTIDGVSVPSDPRANMNTPPGDVNLNVTGPVVVDLQTTDAPLASVVTLRVVPKRGSSSPGTPYDVTATFVGGDQALATWQATLTSIPASGFAALQARVVLP